MYINLVSILQGFIMICCGIWKYQNTPICNPSFKIGRTGISALALITMILSNLPKLLAIIAGPTLLTIFSIIIIISGKDEPDLEY